MKKKYLLPIVCSLVIISCQKEEIVIPYNCTANMIDDETAQNTINNTINLNGSNPYITGVNGTNITFSSNSFLDEDGNIVDGNIDIELLETQDNKDMLLMNCPTVTTGGQLLESGGILYFNPTQNGNQLTINPNEPPVVVVPANSGSPMQLWTGSRDENGSLSWGVTNTTVTIDSQWVNGIQTFSYTFPLTEVGYINCDDLVGGTPSTVQVTLPSENNGSNSTVFCYFKDINSVLTFYDYDEDGTFEGAAIPEGMLVQFVVVSQIEGVRKYCVTSSVDIEPTTHHEIISKDDMEIALCDDALRLLIKEGLE